MPHHESSPTTVDLVTVDDIKEAGPRIASLARRTPTLPAVVAGRNAWLKCENLQVGGSFKIRGAANAVALLSPAELAAGVVAHSSGNHAQALARAARAAGTRATIVMPRDAPLVKQAATREEGAEIVFVDIADRISETERIQQQSGATLIPPFDDPRVIAGQGTVGLEILGDVPDLDAVLVPVSGGGLISGIAVAVKSLRPDVAVIGVEPALAGDLAEGFAAGRRVEWPSSRTGATVADGLRVPSVGVQPWRHIQAYVDDVVTVSEDEIRTAMHDLAVTQHLVAEPSGAVSYAALQVHGPRFGDRPVCVISGGNVEPSLLAEVVGSAA